MAEGKRAGWFRYLKEAFRFRWNLLFLGGAAAAALISGHADVVLPLVAAAEITYLAGLGSVPRFQAAIDARHHRENRGAAVSGDDRSAESAQDRLLAVLRHLGDQRRSRFLRLRARCVEMQRIANAVRGETHDPSGAAKELRAPALDRMLWVFLRLLLSQQALESFLHAAGGADLAENLQKLRRQESAVPGGNERILRSLRDSIATAELRVENFDKARANADFIAVELDRIENKIRALTEMAISAQDPDSLSAQVDAVAEGISQTEATIRELQAITGMSGELDSAPQILSANMDPATEAE
jgi:hypothetical protein